MPVLRYRESEKKALEDVSFSNKILPLVEIVQEKRRSNMAINCIEEIKNYLHTSNTPLLIDFPLYIKFQTNTLANVRDFIGPLIADPKLRLDHFKSFIGTRIIPVVSYNPNTPIFPTGDVAHEINELRKYFDRIALRLYTSHAQSVLSEADGLLRENDIIIVDIDDESHTNPIFTRYFSFVQAIASKHRCKTVLLRAVLGHDVTNTGLTNNQIVNRLDNSHLKDYSGYGFNAFGDYCGIKKDLLTDGGMPSPGCIFYHWWTNAYYGHKGIYKQPATFTTMVVPSLTTSNQWNDYGTHSSSHQANCPGCRAIANIATTGQGGNTAPKWKIMIMSHYLQTMEEFL